MQLISDLHIHSRFSRGTSQDLNITNLEKWAKIKGLGLLGTGDFCHPEWLRELKRELNEDGSGILRTKNDFPFVLSNEVSLMYNQGNKQRRVHLVLLAPSFEIVEKITNYLKTKGRIDYDGRPIFSIPCRDFAEAMFNISDDIEIIPAHAWTPWFGIFGSVTGFDSIEEAFLDKANLIHAFETGMSSDPAMNWRLSRLDKYTIVSFSDSHCYWPWRLGREATVFELQKLTYKNIIESIRNNKIAFTIETPPGYGKYHYDGHRFCNFSCSPSETKKYNGVCPVCRKPLTIGVLHRVEELADRREGFRPSHARPFKSLLPLHELIAAVLQTSVTAKKVWQEYKNLIDAFGNEFCVLLDAPVEQIKKVTSPQIAHAIKLNRDGKIKVKPGYDGKYGELVLEIEKQEKLC